MSRRRGSRGRRPGPARRAAAVAAIAAVCAGALASTAAAAGPSSGYPWPLAPFDQQHPIRGSFGDPRMVFDVRDNLPSSELLSGAGLGGAGKFGFHNGVDIYARPRQAVYPVVSGSVTFVDAYAVRVRTTDGREFRYGHIVPSVKVGDRVVASKTVLGNVDPGSGHVHLTDFSPGGTGVNPLAPGHLSPFTDGTRPIVAAIRFRGGQGQRLAPDALRGTVSIVAQIWTPAATPVPGLWHGLPVAPALVSWQLATPAGKTVVAPVAAVDFRHSLPPKSAFWRVYARGTYQNFPRFSDAFGRLLRIPGRYLFELTPKPLDTRTLPNGSYVLTITSAAQGGASVATTKTIRIAN